MFGCVGRLVILGVIVLAGATAYLTRDRWQPAVAERMRPRRSSSFSTWEAVTSSGASRARVALDSLGRRGGPGFVNVGAGEFAAYALESVVSRLSAAPGSAARGNGAGASQVAAAGTRARAERDAFAIRGNVRIADLGGASSLGALAGVLEGVQEITVRGRLAVPAAGRGLFVVDRIVVGSLTLPDAAIGRVVQLLVARGDTAQAAEAVAVTLPREVGEIRVLPGQVRLYRGVP